MLNPNMMEGVRPVILSRTNSRRAIRVIAIVLGVGIVAAFFSSSAPQPLGQDDLITRDELASRIDRSPADRRLHDRAAELALDLPDETRHELWLQAHAMTRRLARDWPSSQAGFIRGAFLHWPELGDADRALVANEAGVMLSMPELFAQYWARIWVATGDLDMFLRSAPGDADTGVILASLAANAGRFDDYRRIRDGLGDMRARDIESSSPSSEVVLQHLVSIDRRPAMRALMEADLRYLARNRPQGKTISANAISGFVQYAIDNGLSPLGGLFEIGFNPILLNPTLRARLAVAMNNVDLADRIDRSEVMAGHATALTPYRIARANFEIARGNLLDAQSQLSRIAPSDADGDDVLAARAELARVTGRHLEQERAEKTVRENLGSDSLSARWDGLCERRLCRAIASARFYASSPISIALPVEALETDRTGSYLEVALDGRMVDEGVVGKRRTFNVPVKDRGMHRIEIRIINPIRRQWGPRRVVQVLDPVVSVPANESGDPIDDSLRVRGEQPGSR